MGVGYVGGRGGGETASPLFRGSLCFLTAVLPTRLVLNFTGGKAVAGNVLTSSTGST